MFREKLGSMLVRGQSWIDMKSLLSDIASMLLNPINYSVVSILNKYFSNWSTIQFFLFFSSSFRVNQIHLVNIILTF